MQFSLQVVYAKGTKYNPEDNMSLETARNLADLASEIGIKEVIILGGEPTYWKDLFEIIQHIHEKKISSTLVTNGYLLSKNDFLSKIKEF